MLSQDGSPADRPVPRARGGAAGRARAVRRAAGCCRPRPTPPPTSSRGSSATSSRAGSARGSPRTSPEAGAQRAEPVGSTSVLLVRGEDGALRGFANTCRHRGHELLPCGGATTRRSVVCPYHAWSYTLDGDLFAAPGYDGAFDFDAAQFPLRPLRVQEWHGYVFVDLVRRGAAARGVPRRARRPARAAPARAARRRGPAHVRRRGELEDDQRELPGVLPLPRDPPRAVRREPARQRRELVRAGGVGRRLDGHPPRDGDDVPRRAQRRGPHPRPRRVGLDPRRLPRGLPEPARQHAPGLRHDAPDGAARPEPHVGRVRVVVPGRRRRRGRVSTRPTPSTSGT